MISGQTTKAMLTATAALVLLVACTQSSETNPTDNQKPVEEVAPNSPSQPSTPPAPVESNLGAPQASGNLAQGQQPGSPAVQFAQVEPYRTWITLEGFVMEHNGDPENPISNVRLEVVFPSGQKLDLPGNGQYWTIGNGQMQEIKQTFEIPWTAVQADGFNFKVQMVRKGSELLPCNFEVRQLSQFNRKYFCHTDVAWQLNQKVPEDKLEKQGVEVRVFTDKNTPAKEIPKEALALR
jgi:hypothetical protein